MATPAPSFDVTRCPLCGQPNQCAMETPQRIGITQPDCWCTRVDFGAELLARLPESARGAACICASCAAADQLDGRPSSRALRKPPVP